MLGDSLENHSFVHSFLLSQTKYDANQEAKKQLLPVTTGDLVNLDRHRNTPEKSQNGLTAFAQHGDYQYGRTNILTDHFQYNRQNYPTTYNLNRFDIQSPGAQVQTVISKCPQHYQKLLVHP